MAPLLQREFLFEIQYSQPAASASASGPSFEAMLADLTGSVLRHAGCTEPAIAEVQRDLRSTVAGAVATGACDVRFRATAREIEISVMNGNGRIFHASRPLD